MSRLIEQHCQPVELQEPEQWPMQVELCGQLLWIRVLEPYSPAKHGGGLLQVDKYEVSFCTHRLSTLGHTMYLSMNNAVLYRPIDAAAVEQRTWSISEEMPWFIYNHFTAEQARNTLLGQLGNPSLHLAAREPPPAPVGLALINSQEHLISIFTDQTAMRKQVDQLTQQEQQLRVVNF